MNLRPVLPILTAAVLLVLPSPAAASQAEYELEVGVPVKLLGTIAADLPEARILTTGDAGTLAVDIDFASARDREIRLHRAYQNLANGNRLLREERVEESQTSYAAGSARLAERQADFYAHLSVQDGHWSSTAPGAAPDAVWIRANAQLTPLLREKALAPLPTAAFNLPLAGAGPAPPPPVVPAGHVELRADRAALAAQAREITWYSGTVELDLQGRSTTLRSQRTTETAPGSVWVPPIPGEPQGSWTGPGTHLEETTTYHVLAPEAGSATVEAGDTATLAYAPKLEARVDGYAGLPWAKGTLTVKGEARDLRGDQAVLGGNLRLLVQAAPAGAAPALRLSGSGDLTFLKIGPSSQQLPLEVLVAAGSGAAVAAVGLGAGLYYWPLLKWSLSGLFAPLYARLPKDRILEHKGRELVYERIRTEPGISTNKLARDFPFGWSTLTYHLRVLERNEAIVSVRDGRYKRFFDRESGKYANGRKFVVAVLKNDASLALGRHVLGHAGITQKELGEAFGLAPSSVHWHMERLEEAKLVDKRRAGHNVRYHPGRAWDEVHPEDLGLQSFNAQEPRIADWGAPAPVPGAPAPRVPPGA